jgi:ATP-dependent helicase IRC3
VDEAHHAAAPSFVSNSICTLEELTFHCRYRRLLSRFHTAIKHPEASVEPLKLRHAIPIIGFSATFSRHDGLALGSVFERIVYHRDFLEMIKEQWYAHFVPFRDFNHSGRTLRLCDVRFTSVRANIDLKNVTISLRTGDFNATSLAHIINTETVNNLVVQTWLDRAGVSHLSYSQSR